jgi:hypothetical protein
MPSIDVFRILSPLTIVLLTCGLWQLRKGHRQLGERDAVEDIQTLSVSELHEGTVEICGIANSNSIVPSPLQGMDCISFYYTVERPLEKERFSLALTPDDNPLANSNLQGVDEGLPTGWIMIDQGNRNEEFEVNDGTGRVAVDPRGSEFKFMQSYEYEADAPDGKKFLPPPLLRFVESRNIEMNKLTRFREWIIKPGEKVFVLGLAKRAKQKREKRRPAFTIGKEEGQEFIISNGSKMDLQMRLRTGGRKNYILGVVLCGLAAVCILYLVWRHFISM